MFRSSRASLAVLEAQRLADRELFLSRDPIGVVRAQAQPADMEIAALLAASIALGRAATIRSRVAELLRRLSDSGGRLRLESASDVHSRLRGFRHRFLDTAAIAEMAFRAGRARRDFGGLEALFPFDDRAVSSPPELRQAAYRSACARFAHALDPGCRVLPDPERGSACKRLHLFLRWVVRADDGVDLGLWTRPASMLLVPLDVHVHRIARDIGLTRLASPSWRAAEEVTAALRLIAPDDPVRFDFALSHIGITGGCSARGCRLGARCPLAAICGRGQAGKPRHRSPHKRLMSGR